MIAQNIQGINNATNTKGVVLENIHTPPPPHGRQRKFRGKGESKKRQFLGGWGLLTEVFSRGSE